MKIYKAKDYQDMSRKAANIISAQVITKPDCVLGLATGSTPEGMYAQLVEWYKKGDLDFSEVKSVNLDEYRGMTRDNDQSYYYFMHKHLFDHVNIDPANTHLPNGIAEDPQEECILLMVSGEDKAETLAKALCGPITPEVPASVLQLHNDVVVVADEAALSAME